MISGKENTGISSRIMNDNPDLIFKNKFLIYNPVIHKYH
jgi:hypothetical protein